MDHRRRGRAIDVVALPSQPTPRAHRTSAFPPSPPATKHKHHASAAASSSRLPTPQSLPRPPRSPSGQTTFVRAPGHAPAQGGGVPAGRRPGLLFNQQMGLLSAAGRGVGIGGSRHSAPAGRVDDVRAALAPPIEDNPFLDRPTRAQARAREGSVSTAAGSDDEDAVRGKDQYKRASLVAAGSLLSPPPTQRAPRVRKAEATAAVAVAQQEEEARLVAAEQAKVRAREEQARAVAATAALRQREEEQARSARDRERARWLEERRRMVDEDDNPFIAKRGEVVRPRPTDDDERPTMKWVFRGQVREYINPYLYLPLTSASSLPPSDPQFSPDPCPAPRLLWPTGPRGTPHAARKGVAAARPAPLDASAADADAGASSAPVATGNKRPAPVTPRRRTGKRFVLDDQNEGEEEDEEEEEEEPQVRRGLLFAAPPEKRARR
ncbi:hypothetical protein Q5752_000905 [Cryptotrichosporon argae]